VKLFQIGVAKKLHGLATIALERDILEKIKYGDIVEDFILKNTRE